MLGAAITDIKLNLTAGNMYVFPAVKLSLISVIAAPNITY
jgi:hypothetical protein